MKRAEEVLEQCSWGDWQRERRSPREQQRRQK
jgi:hypothetical protein